jgi:hypothetical protein
MPISHAKRTPTSAAGVSRLELLLCLTVVAVLIALLLPRLAELGGATRAARLRAAVAQVRAAANVFHARCEALRSSDSANDCALVALDGVPVAGVNGWPAPSAAGIARAASLPLGGDARSAGFTAQPRVRDGTQALALRLLRPDCEFLYVQAKSRDDSPEVDIVDASCH